MSRIHAVAALLLIALIASPSVAADSDLEMPFLKGLTMITLEDGDIPSLHRARQEIEARGGRIAVMSPPSILIGWVPQEVGDRLVGVAGIERVHYSEVTKADLPRGTMRERAMGKFFNAAVSGDLEKRQNRERAALAAQRAQPLREPDVFERPPYDAAAVEANLRAVGLNPGKLEERGVFRSQAAVAGNSDIMSGTAAVSVFFVESDGSGTDPDLYTWTIDDMQRYLDGVVSGLAFWAFDAFANGCSVTWLVYWYSANDPVTQQWVEPVLHSSSWQTTWGSAIMDNLGFTSGSLWSQTDAFNTWQRSTYATDRAFTAFVPYNPAPAPSQFTNGSSAYAYLGGPFTVLLYRTGWTPGEVFPHETGHIFNACDEYAGGCSSCGPCGMWGVDNGNCEVCSANSRGCMMRENAFFLCGYTPGQLGWTQVPCTPPPPAPLPAPSVSSSSPPTGVQGFSASVTITGADFYPGLWVDFGPDIFTDKVTVSGSTSITADITISNSAPLGFYDATVTNRDFQSATLTGALEVLPTRQHYYSPAGNNVFPYITAADAATTLEDAIAASFGGDTLYVVTGTHTNLTLDIDRGVLLHGGWSADFTSRDIVTGKTMFQLAGNVTIYPGADGAGLDGFIIENGYGSLGTSPYSAKYGGGLRVLGAQATIANCEIRNCQGSLSAVELAVGGGVYAEFSNLNINNTAIENNSATLGGGLYLYQCSGSMTDNVISSNTVATSTLTGNGAGLYLDQCTSLTLSGNSISGNLGSADGGGIRVDDCAGVLVTGGDISYNNASFSGAGLYARSSDVQLSGVDFLRNQSSVLGGGVACADNSDATIEDCRLMWNSAILGGGLNASGGVVNARHNLLVGNSATSGGAGMQMSGLSGGEVKGNTLDRNVGGGVAGALGVGGSPIAVFNNIVTHSTGNGISCSGPTAESYNLVSGSTGSDWDGCSPGVGSGSWGVAFADTASGDYRLLMHSGGIDAGEPSPANGDADGSRGDLGIYGSHAVAMAQPGYVTGFNAQALGGNAVLSWDRNPEGDIAHYAIYCDTISAFKPGPGKFVTTTPDTTVNLGAVSDTTYYVVNAVDSAGYAGGYSDEGSVFSTATGIGDGPRPFVTRLYQNVPNPFNPVTTVRYELSAAGHVSLAIYDVAGRLVRRLVDGPQAAGPHATAWTGTNDRGEQVSSGVYFYRLRANGITQTRKMVLLK